MLINLSNHPSNLWSPEQIEEANRKFGYIKDVPFPQIDPKATHDDIISLAWQYKQNIERISQDSLEKTFVHIMGEMTFTHQLVTMLKTFSGIQCYAATTERNVRYEGDKKISTFDFIQFREY